MSSKILIGEISIILLLSSISHYRSVLLRNDNIFPRILQNCEPLSIIISNTSFTA
jgi:hypothetical protein